MQIPFLGRKSFVTKNIEGTYSPAFDCFQQKEVFFYGQ